MCSIVPSEHGAHLSTLKIDHLKLRNVKKQQGIKLYSLKKAGIKLGIPRKSEKAADLITPLLRHEIKKCQSKIKRLITDNNQQDVETLLENTEAK